VVGRFEVAQWPYRLGDGVLRVGLLGPKLHVYDAVATVAELRSALSKGLLASCRDVYGDLEPVAAPALLSRINLPEDIDTSPRHVGRANLRRGAAAISCAALRPPAPGQSGPQN
jgi:hypothetical protein